MTPFSMELPFPTVGSVGFYSTLSSSARLFSNGVSFSYRSFCRKSLPLSIHLRLKRNAKLSNYFDRETGANGEDFEQKSNLVEVIGIGSRKYAVLDFCLESSFALSSLRFWTIHMRDSRKVQLLQRSLGQDLFLTNVEGPLSMHSCPRAIILVATAGYGLDHLTAMDLLSSVRSTDGLAVGIIVKPFSFEGQRRQQEVEELVNKLREGTNFCIVVETDALLKKEAVTLAEALRSANNAVLLAINSISILMSETHPKLLDAPRDKIKELKISEILTLLENYGEATVGFGAGYSIKSSVAKAVFDCPFLNGGSLKDLTGTVICTFSSADVMDTGNIYSFMRAFRQTSQCKTDVIFSRILEPNLEPHLIVTTLIIISCNKEKVSQELGFFSGLALRFPFVFSLLGRHPQDHPRAHSLDNSFPLEGVLSSSDGRDMTDFNPRDGMIESFVVYGEEVETPIGTDYDEIGGSRKLNGGDARNGAGFSQSSPESVSPVYLMEGEPASESKPLNSWNIGPGFHLAQEWAKERAAALRATPRTEKLNVYTLPVGVKLSEQSKDAHQFSGMSQSTVPTTFDDMKLKRDSSDISNVPSWDALADAGFEAVKDFYKNASTLLKGKYADDSKKQALLSIRAASMLEAERDSEKKWSPVMEIPYRGGIYRGRCQGGLPEGKGRLVLTDGSFYDGMWRYGKRSGLGTFYYSNGDMFQGAWRDDLMHGKGWFYFHTGDRWFSNFWKGKANGEGRFYSKSGDIFFCNFQDGWRHGESLYIDADGTRWVEVWEEGSLVSRKQLDTGTDTAQNTVSS